MVLKSDFQDTLEFFIFSNLPILMNPGNAINVVVSNEIISTIPTTPLTPTSAVPTVSTAPVLVITPETLQALQSYTINNFPDIGLPQDIAEIAKDFIANLPPLIPINQNTAVTATVTI
ncbi:hypothetical protein [Pelosinus propionicus]|uniref:Uncharacterized protein n=1 Tax=Pelosinus propionicus DSM 13327 TaxID=1123291 RepID=A0A1I4H2F2_9FIRM|nr:hypothetical protein [Pelosinus propionicus]SFL35596.1 hypothetical protein SAMN04490355_100277 [Pelosinus propionicus DSM 13327]